MTHGTTLQRLERDLGELIERHERGRDLSEFSGYVDDPVGFIRDVLQGRPWKRQAEIALAVKDTPLVVVRGCNASGKDWLAARLALWWVYARRGLVLVTGPTERQVREVVMGEVGRAFRRASDLHGDLYASALRLPNAEHGGILAFTSTEASRLTGFHAARVLGVLTEAQGVEDFAWEGLLACATGSDDRVLAVGNPLMPAGRFYTASRPHSAWRAITISAQEHPNITEGRTVIPGGPSPEFVQRIAREFGKGSGTYQARVLGEFPDQGEESLFRRSKIERAMEHHQTETFVAEAQASERIVAIDPARLGPDHTVLGLRRGPRLEKFVEWRGLDLMETVSKARRHLDRMGVRAFHEVTLRPHERGWLNSATRREGGRGHVIVDEVGLGAGVMDRLREIGFTVSGFNGGWRPFGSTETHRFANLRAASFWRLRELLDQEQIALPPDEDLADELLATTWRPTAEGKVALPPKDEIRSLIGRSPDRADVVAMAFSAAVRRVPQRAAVHW